MIRVSQSFLSLEISNINLEMVSNWYPGRACKTDPNLELVNDWYPGRAVKQRAVCSGSDGTPVRTLHLGGCFHPACTPEKTSSFQKAHLSSSAGGAERMKRLNSQKLYSSTWGNFIFSYFEGLISFLKWRYN